LREKVRASPLALGLVALSGRTFVELSPVGAALLGLCSRDASVDLAALTCDPAGVRQTLSLIAEAVLDACRIRTTLTVPGGDDRVLVSLDVLARDGEETYAVALLELVGSNDNADVVERLEGTRGHGSLTSAGSLRCDRSNLEPMAAFGRGPSPVGDRARLEELEQRLRQIAKEIAAARALDRDRTDLDTPPFPGLEDLTARQHEILARLLRGERVPTISRGMYLAASTVRNHLTTIYRKVGVHSQAELIELVHAQAKI